MDLLSGWRHFDDETDEIVIRQTDRLLII